MEEISWPTTCYLLNPVKNGTFSISTGAGFLPSTVDLHEAHLQVATSAAATHAVSRDFGGMFFLGNGSRKEELIDDLG